MINNLISSVLVFLLSIIPSFSNQTTDLPNNQISILFTGDVMLGRSVMLETLEKGNFSYPFVKVTPFLSEADVTFVNLENAIIENCPKQGKGSFTFCTSPEIAQGLHLAGVDIVTLANNHSGNYGEEGLLETKDFLNKMGIKWVDGTNCEVIEKNDIKFAFVGLNFIYRELTQKDLTLITECKQKSDVLIVSPHWGEEYKAVASSMQQIAGKKIIDAGADVIIGHHPHWVQNYEEYQGKPIYYSLGNFIFDQMWSEETKKGLVVKMTFEKDKIVKKEEFKTYIKNIGQPEIVKE